MTLPTAKPENIARVKTRGLFRYPGGKTWFAPSLLRFFQAHPPELFVETFAGGAALSATVLEHTPARVWLNELDPDVHAVHATVYSDHAPQLAQRILDFPFRRETVLEVLHATPRTTLDRAFRTLVRNRVNRGGILAPGAGLVKKGENGKGLAQRWYPATLAGRIAVLHAHRHRVTVTRGDALSILERTPFHPGTVVFVDPPYTAGKKSAGKRLYTHHQLDHARLFAACATLRVPWLMTHEHDEAVMALAWDHGLAWRPIKMTSGHGVTAKELVVARDFTWADLPEQPAPPPPARMPSLFPQDDVPPHVRSTRG
ncbi:DNA adenine methylase [Deinococcus sp. NW-56]|uniref:DNA adenine methylase n=1 Tax=Deinococcus sp. NW-56 TaxID=2080419 RepID=UPI000CF4E4E8|nr:DNA adenine methylase [Deinococcus sp. NW-56]